MSEDITERETQKEHIVTLSDYPQNLLKSIETLKRMGLNEVTFQMAFHTIDETQKFTQILNRELDEQRVANQLKTTYFHNIRGKIQMLTMVKDQEYTTMKKIRLTSSYHATLFLKFYNQRIEQLQNEYKYKFVLGKSGQIHIYLNQETISCLFVNEIRDLKRKLQFLEIKDLQLCQKFMYSQILCNQLKKIKIFHQVWYKGKQSTIIFYSQNIPLSKMKLMILEVSKFHMTILRMVDEKFSFLINSLFFGLMKKMINQDIQKLESIDPHMVELNQNKLGIVLHDKHQTFAQGNKRQVLEIMKKIVFICLKSRNARQLYNFVRKQFRQDTFILTSYSKKATCLCINLEKIQKVSELTRVFKFLGSIINADSQIGFHWFHLQEEYLKEIKSSIVQKFDIILSRSKFTVENWANFKELNDCKCILKIKNACRNTEDISEYVGQILTKLVLSWSTEEIKESKFEQIAQPQFQQIQPLENDQSCNQNVQNSLNDQSFSMSEANISKQNIEFKAKVVNKSTINHPSQNPLTNNFKLNYFKTMKQNASLQKFTEFMDQKYFRQGKRLKLIQRTLQKDNKINSKINLIEINKSIETNFSNQLKIDQIVLFLQFQVFKLNSNLRMTQKWQRFDFLYQLQELKQGSKYAAILVSDLTNRNSMIYPLLTIEILNAFKH